MRLEKANQFKLGSLKISIKLDFSWIRKRFKLPESQKGRYYTTNYMEISNNNNQKKKQTTTEVGVMAERIKLPPGVPKPVSKP